MQPHHIRKIVPSRPAQTRKTAPAQFTGHGQQLLKALNLDALRKRQDGDTLRKNEVAGTTAIATPKAAKP